MSSTAIWWVVCHPNVQVTLEENSKSVGSRKSTMRGISRQGLKPWLLHASETIWATKRSVWILVKVTTVVVSSWSLRRSIVSLTRWIWRVAERVQLGSKSRRKSWVALPSWCMISTLAAYIRWKIVIKPLLESRWVRKQTWLNAWGHLRLSKTRRSAQQIRVLTRSTLSDF